MRMAFLLNNMTIEHSNKKTISIGIIVSIVLFFAALVVSKLLKDVLLLSDEAALFSSRIAIWVALAVLFIYVRQFEKQPLLLWQEKKYSIVHYILSVITTLLTVVAVLILFSIVWTLLGLKKDSNSLNKIIDIFRHNHLLVVLTCLTAGITEELVFRGL